MGKLAIKEKVIRKIEQIDSKQYLEALYNFIEDSKTFLHYVNKIEKLELKTALKNIRNRASSEKEFFDEAAKWLKRRNK